MKKCLQDEVLKNLRNIYCYINQPLPPAFIRYARINCQDDYSKLAGNPRFQSYIDELEAFPDNYLEFKRIYHRLLIDLHRNNKTIS